MLIKWKILLVVSLFLSFTGIAKAKERENRKVTIGVKIAPPFVDKDKDIFRGLSIDSWELVNTELDWEFEFKEYATLQELLTAVENNEVDFSINPVTVTAERSRRFHFTQPYFISNTAMVKKRESAVWNVFVNLWTWKFISAVGILIGVIFIFGFLVWIFEHRKNREQFGVGKWKGLGQGFWWSAVTMTTVGYGDKAPQTTMGRIVGLIWMFIAIISISSLTAGIASSLTVQNLSNEIRSIDDLHNFKVETIHDSSTGDYLQSYYVHFNSVDNIEEGIQHLQDEISDIFVYDEPLVRFEIERMRLKKKIDILPYTLRKDYFAYCFPINSELVEEINPVLINSLKSKQWMSVIKNYQKP